MTPAKRTPWLARAWDALLNDEYVLFAVAVVVLVVCVALWLIFKP